MSKLLTLPNCITLVRIVGALILLFVLPLSPAFYVVYTLCGLSDILDGWVARCTKSVSELGSKLDSLADLLFYTVMMLKILPILYQRLPHWIWWIVGAAVVVRLISYGVAALKFHRFASLHTYLNKLSGGAVFSIPYFINWPCATVLSTLVCLITLLASLEELVIHLRQKEYDSHIHTLLPIKSSSKEKS